MNSEKMPVCRVMCSTCPFRKGSKFAHLAAGIAESALTGDGRICHSTGPANAVNPRPAFVAHLCRGARDLQLRLFAGMGFIEAATDEAWNDKRVELGMVRIETKDPERRKKCD
jgi:hypothetical protein